MLIIKGISVQVFTVQSENLVRFIDKFRDQRIKVMLIPGNDQ